MPFSRSSVLLNPKTGLPGLSWLDVGPVAVISKAVSKGELTFRLLFIYIGR